MKHILLFLIPILLGACCTTTPPPDEENYKTILSSHEPLTDAQLDQMIALLRTPSTLTDVREYIIDRLSTEDYSTFHSKIRSSYGMPVPLGDGTEFIMSSPPRNPEFYLISKQQLVKNYVSGLEYIPEIQLIVFHVPEPNEELGYIQSMLDFMELPIPYNRKINGLRNIQRVMTASNTHNNLNTPEMADIRERLYALSHNEKSPDMLRRELAEWLREMH